VPKLDSDPIYSLTPFTTRRRCKTGGGRCRRIVRSTSWHVLPSNLLPREDSSAGLEGIQHQREFLPRAVGSPRSRRSRHACVGCTTERDRTRGPTFPGSASASRRSGGSSRGREFRGRYTDLLPGEVSGEVPAYWLLHRPRFHGVDERPGIPGTGIPGTVTGIRHWLRGCTRSFGYRPHNRRAGQRFRHLGRLLATVPVR